MTTSIASMGRASLLAVAVAFGGAPVLAQGTPEQRAACAPDAVRLCADTVPDIGRTTQCMQAHRSELTPRCREAFDAGTPSSAKPPTHVARKPPQSSVRAESTPAPRPRPRGIAVAPTPHRVRVAVHSHRHGGDRDAREARRVIGRLCGTGLVDSGTCGFMGKVMSLAD